MNRETAEEDARAGTSIPEQLFRPDTGKGPGYSTLLFLAFVLIVILIGAPDWGSRLSFLAFAAVFLALYLWFVQRAARDRGHALRLHPSGLRYSPLVKTCGTDTIPWPEIRSMDIFYGTRGPGVPGPGPRWLRIRLEDGPLRRQVATRAIERIAGGDVNILLDFDAPADAILHAARAFRARHAGTPR